MRSGWPTLVSAPGVDIESTGPKNWYRMGTGTSDSTAITAGVVALIRSRFPTLSATEVIHRLTATATDRGPKGRDPEYGYGIVNPYAALTADLPPASASPAADSSPSVSGVGQSPRGSGGGKRTLLIAAAVAVALGVIVLGAVSVLRRRA
jgi:subtilisin family serine protease